MNRRKFSFERLEDRHMLNADFSGNGMVGAEDLGIWKANFGTVQTATQPTGDSDGDMDVDGADFLAWQRTLGQSTAPLVAPKGGQARAVGPTSIEVTWQPSVGATSYIVIRRQPITETFYTIVAPNVTGTSFIDTGLASDTLYEYRVAAQRNPQSPYGPPLEAVTNQSNLTGYRPQFVQDFDNPTDGPIYDPLPKFPVVEQQEDSSTVGPGIRINTDDDNGNSIQDRSEAGAAVPQENDLIEVKIDRLPGAGELSLSHGGRLQVFYHHDRTQQILSGDPIGFVKDTATVFVEWTSSTHGTDFLTLVDAAQTPLDTLVFHSFRSIVIVFGGNGQSPIDADGDGRMGDPSLGLFGGPNDREGIFDLATNLYVTGWDVLPFGEEELIEGSAETTIAYQEVTNALDRRFVGFQYGGGFSFMGYSQGGGASHDLIEAVYYRNTQPGPEDVTTFGVYLDAVDHNLPDDLTAPETRYPETVFYLLNIYQTNGFPRGNALTEPALGTLNEFDVSETQGWNNTLDHYSIDDDVQVQGYIRSLLEQLLDSR